MDYYYIHSVLSEWNKKIIKLIEEGRFEGKCVAIYGGNEDSFRVKTLLGNHGIITSYYVLDSIAETKALLRRIKGVGARFFNSTDSAVMPIFVGGDNYTKDNLIIINASLTANKELLKKNGFFENVNLFSVCSKCDEFEEKYRNERRLNTKELQDIEKNILAAFDSFCTENKLRYWVCGGTLLGTIRHKGFIPWDDDVDVLMPYKDYKRFIELYKNNDDYIVSTMERKEDREKHFDFWGKMADKKTIVRERLGLYDVYYSAWLDIFVINGIPSDAMEREDLFERVDEIRHLSIEKFYSSGGNIYEKNSLYDEFKKLFEEIDFDKAEYVGVLGTSYREKDYTSKAVYNETLRLPFEDIMVNVPGGYKEYLDNLYGTDWMEIPPLDKRKTHQLDAYYRKD